MILPSDTELLANWELATRQSWVQRALTLLCAFHPESDRDALSRLPIGERDARLLSIRATMFGPAVDCLARCPRCGEQMEASFSIDDVLTRLGGGGSAIDEPYTLERDGYEVTFRLPNSLDLLALDERRDGWSPERQLLVACVLETKDRSTVVTTDVVPDDIVSAVAERLADADPLADVQLALECEVCGHQWNATFDIVTHLWAEIDARARRLLSEVHTLASAYGWRERDVLSLSPVRRQAYLELVGAG